MKHPRVVFVPDEDLPYDATTFARFNAQEMKSQSKPEAAVDLVFRAKTSQPEIYKEGIPVSPFGRMQGLFDDEYGDSRVTDATTLLLADLLNSGRPSEVRKVLAMYNKAAGESAAGAVDIFSESGQPDSKEEILTRVNELFSNGTAREKQELVDAAIADRKQRASAEQAERGGGEAADEAADAGRRSEGREERAGGNRGELADHLSREERHARIAEHLGVKYSFSDEAANHGEVFYQNAEGSTVLTEIPDEIFERIGIDALPFKLTETMAWHVYTNHAKELGLKDLDDAIDLVLDIVNNVDHVRLGRDNSYIFSVENGRRGIARRAVTIVIKADSGDFMGIRTSGYDRVRNLKERPVLWEKGADSTPEAIATPTVTTIKALQGDEHVGHTESQSTGEMKDTIQAAASQPHGHASDGKDNALSSDKQAEGTESLKGDSAGMREFLEELKGVTAWSEDLKRDVERELRGMADEIAEAHSREILHIVDNNDNERSEEKIGEIVKDHMSRRLIEGKRELIDRAFGDVSTRTARGEELMGYLHRALIHEAANRIIDRRNQNEPTTPGERIAEAGKDVNLSPTEAQKKAGNYRKGHVQVGTFDVTIENPAGSKRSGTDAEGKKWETTMTHAYGYIRGTESVDGDHIDVFLSSDIDDWNGRKVFVVDQYNPDDTFDEHKVMLGFNDRDEAFSAYLSNYEDGWEKGRRLDCTEVNLDDFEKWIDSSKRKTKPFADYKSVKALTEEADQTRTNINKDGIVTDGKGKPIEDKDLDGFGYTITPTQYQSKKKKDPTPVRVVKFDRDLSYEEQRGFCRRYQTNYGGGT